MTRMGSLIAVLLSGLLLAPAFGERTSRVEISSDPSGYDVWLNNRYAGRTPIAATVTPGRNLLVLGRAAIDSIFSAPAADTLLEVAEGETLHVHVTPRGPLPAMTGPIAVAGASPPLSGGESPLLKRLGRYALPVFAAACIGAGALIERGADRAYDRYRRSADPQEIRRNYDAAHVRDSWSTVLWTAGETSLAASILSWIIPDRDRQHAEGEGAKR